MVPVILSSLLDVFFVASGSENVKCVLESGYYKWKMPRLHCQLLFY